MDQEFHLGKKHIFLAVGLILMSFVFYLAVQAVLFFNLKYEKALIEKEDLTQVLGKINQNSFDDLDLSSKAYLVWDSREEEIVSSKKAEIQLPLASLTKLMTVYLANNKFKNNTSLTLNEDNLLKEGDSGLLLGEKWNLTQLINFVLMTSSNDGANALASIKNSEALGQESFISEMNIMAQSLGMVQSYFLNESGLDVNEKISGAYGSAKDVSILMEEILKQNPKLLLASIEKEKNIASSEVVHQANNTNLIVDKLPGVLASKTGYTDLAGGNLVMAFDLGLGHQIIIVVLGSTKEERFSDMEKLFWASMENNSNFLVKKIEIQT